MTETIKEFLEVLQRNHALAGQSKRLALGPLLALRRVCSRSSAALSPVHPLIWQSKSPTRAQTIARRAAPLPNLPVLDERPDTAAVLVRHPRAQRKQRSTERPLVL